MTTHSRNSRPRAAGGDARRQRAADGSRRPSSRIAAARGERLAEVVCCIPGDEASNGASGVCAPALRTSAAPRGATAALSRRLKALADPTRLEIVSRLLAAPEPVCVCDLMCGFGLGQPTVSHHLKRLRQAGLVRAQRRGTWVYYRADRGALEEVGRLLAAL